jgi:hypothetical protein
MFKGTKRESGKVISKKRQQLGRQLTRMSINGEINKLDTVKRYRERVSKKELNYFRRTARNREHWQDNITENET